MRKSLTYYLTLAVIKLKGVKNTFDTVPIDYLKLRKEDIHCPNSSYFNKERTRVFQVLGTTITEVRPKAPSKKLLLFVHGGAFVYGPVKHHWDVLEKISRHTGCTIWMCDYPKAPEHTISELSKNMDEIYDRAEKSVAPGSILCIGDSVGATLIITLTQRLIKKNRRLPGKLFLVSPVIDPTFAHPAIDAIDLTDPILSKKGVLSAKRMCAENQDLRDPRLSPIVGSAESFPETVLFMAENDITYPDQQLFVEKLHESNVKTTTFIGKGMPHIWPFLPVMKEAKRALNTIIERINES